MAVLAVSAGGLIWNQAVLWALIETVGIPAPYRQGRRDRLCLLLELQHAPLLCVRENEVAGVLIKMAIMALLGLSAIGLGAPLLRLLACTILRISILCWMF